MFGISEASAYRYFKDGLEALEKILPVPLPCNKGLKLILEGGILEELNKFGEGERIELFLDKGYEGVEKKIDSFRQIKS